MANALYQHFLNHPLAEVTVSVGGEPVPGATDAYHPDLRGYLGYVHVNSPAGSAPASPPTSQGTALARWTGGR